MSQSVLPTPGPWSRVWNENGGLILITAATVHGPVTIAAVNGDREADAILISLVPEMFLAVRTGQVVQARAALAEAGLA